MENFNYKTSLLLGEDAVDRLKKAKIAVAGLGGVGSYACEALARSGVGELILIDKDQVDETNLNRQLFALRSTVGQQKALLAKARVGDINPDCAVTARTACIGEDNVGELIPAGVHCIFDCVDMVSAKMALIRYAKEHGIPIISSMGMGNKTDPTKIAAADLEKTSVCPLAKIVRGLCRKEGIRGVKVVFSTEVPKVRLAPPASIVFVPAAAGLLMAREALFDFLEI